jgi:hypothetical protein
MADIKIGALPAATALTGAEIFEVVQGGASKKATGDQISALTGSTANATLNTRLNALAPRQGVVLNQAVAVTDATTALLLTNPDAFTLVWNGVITRYPTTSGQNVPLIGNNRGVSGHNAGTFGLAVINTGVIRAVNEKDASTSEFETFGYTAPLNTPLSLVLTLDKPTRTTKLYVNGVQIGGDQVFDSLTIDATTFAIRLFSYLQGDIDAGRNVNGATHSAAVFHNFAIPATTTSGVVGVAERYASGVWVQPSERYNNQSATAWAAGITINFSGANVWETFSGGVGGFSGENTTGNAIAGTPSIASGSDLLTGSRVRIRGTVVYNSGSGLVVRLSDNDGAVSSTTSPVLTAGAFDVILTTGAVRNTRRIVFSAENNLMDVVVSDFTYEVLGSTLDLIPQGVGRVLIDRSASRNHAIVSGTVHPTYLQPAESGRIIATTNLATNQQLLALSAFDAANKYRITSWTVTSTGTPTISLGNASAGTQYVNGLTLVANTPTAVTLATSIAATANLWCNSDTTDPVTHVITYERIS